MSTATSPDPGKPRRWSSAISKAISHALLIFCSCGLVSTAAAESALQAWNRIKDKGSCEDFRRFVSDYGDTPLASMARRKVKDCEREDEQALAEEWRRVKDRGSCSSFRDFLNRHPDAPSAPEARAEVERCEAEKAQAAEEARIRAEAEERARAQREAEQRARREA
jgi:hypothetical protein